MLGKHYLCAVVTQEEHGQPAQATWGTPNTMDYMEPRSPEAMKRMLEHGHRKNRKWSSNVMEQVVWQEHFGQADRANHSTNGSRQGLWGTPAANDANKTPHCEVDSKQAGLARSVGLELQRQWATPIMGDSHLASTQEAAQKRMAEGKVTLSRQNPGKLNPRWVETLMGLPVGWVMPSCSSPVIIAPTSCDCSEMESFHRLPRERGEC